jgi:excisionase family DNA binding protein
MNFGVRTGEAMGFNREDYLTIDEVAEYFGKQPQTIRFWIRKGRLPARRSGPFRTSALLVKQADMLALERKIAAGEYLE